MEIFKVYESTMANVQPGHSMKHLRRDQLLDNYETAAKTLQTLIRAKENEISHRKDLLKMIEESKTYHDSRMHQAKQEYQTAKSHIPEGLDLKAINVKFERSTTPPMPPPSSTLTSITRPPPASQTLPLQIPLPSSISPTQPPHSVIVTRSSEIDIPLPSDNYSENRSSLDRRLSEFLKTFPNLNQAGGPATTGNNTTADVSKPTPGYYTQQPPLSTAPPSMELLRFPPPNMMPPMPLQPPPRPMQNLHHMNHQENHEPTDMDLSDMEDSSATGGGGLLPMVASAMQQGAGGKSNIPPPNFVAGQQYNNPIQYAPRLNPLAFDPAIMDPSLGVSPSSSSGARGDRHGEKSGHRYSSGSSNDGRKHGSSKNRYSSSSSSQSSHSSSRDKRK